MQEWDVGIYQWRSNKIRHRFYNKYGRSLGSVKKGCVSRASRRNSKQRRLRYSSRKVNFEWAKGAYARTQQLHLTRTINKLKQKSKLLFNNKNCEWSEGFTYWGSYKLCTNSWKSIKPKKLEYSSRKRLRNALKNRLKRRLISNFNINANVRKGAASSLRSQNLESNTKLKSSNLVHVYKRGLHLGPYSVNQLQFLIDREEFLSSDLGFYKGKKYWIPLSCIDGLSFTKKVITPKITDHKTIYGNQVFPSRESKLTYKWIGLAIAVFSVTLLLFVFFKNNISENTLTNETFGTQEGFKSKKRDKEKFTDLLGEILSDSPQNRRSTNSILLQSNNQHIEKLVPIIEKKDHVLRAKLGELKRYLVPSVRMKMIWCAPGSFWMGSRENEEGRSDNEKLHKVSVKAGFYLGECEVKQGQWEIIKKDNSFSWQGPDLPVESVTWGEALNYCDELTNIERNAGRLGEGWRFSLPTEVQWEYACRSGTRSAFNIGDTISSNNANINGSIPYGGSEGGMKSYRTVNCGSFKPNAGGFYDMHGNVWEWCLDWYDKNNLRQTDSLIPKNGNYKVKRGGSWFNGPQNVRSAKRFSSTPKFRHETLGFRIVIIKVKN